MKTKERKGISLIVLIITIIVVIILAAVVILTLSKNNPIESAKEARFKEDVRTFQDELALTVSKQYTIEGGHRDTKISTSDFDKIKEHIPSFSENYRDKFVIQDDEIYYTSKVNKKEENYLISLSIKKQELKYISDGLILYFDGINNTRAGNNPNATMWEDLSGNENDGTFINPNNTIRYTGNGYEFTNNSDFIESVKKLRLSNDPDVTFEFVLKWYDNQTNQHCSGFFYCGSNNAADGMSFIGFSNYKGRTTFSTCNTNVSTELLDKKELNLTYLKEHGVFNENTAKIYKNSVLVSNDLAGSASMNLEDTTLKIGRGWQFRDDNRTFNGIIYAVRVYNRVLTEDEIKYNYEVDKERFGIE